MKDKIDLAILTHSDDSFYIMNFDKIRMNTILLYKYLCRFYETDNDKIYKECLNILISKEKKYLLNKIYYGILVQSELINIKNGNLFVDITFKDEKII